MNVTDKPKNGYVIFKVSKDIASTEKAILVEIKKTEYRFPKSMCLLGYHPSGLTIAIDVDKRIAKSNGLHVI
jgi:hypothetical protein